MNIGLFYPYVEKEQSLSVLLRWEQLKSLVTLSISNAEMLGCAGGGGLRGRGLPKGVDARPGLGGHSPAT